MIVGQSSQVFLLMIDVVHVCFVLKIMLMIENHDPYLRFQVKCYQTGDSPLYCQWCQANCL